MNLLRQIGGRFAGKSLLVIFVQGISLLAGFGLNVALARFFGAKVFATIGYATTLGSLLAPFCALGLFQAGVKFIAIYRLKKEWGHLRGLLRFSFGLTLIVSTVMSVAMIGIGFGVDKYIVKFGLFLAAMLLPLQAIVSLQQRNLLGFEKPISSIVPYGLVRPCIIVGLGALALITLPTSSMFSGMAATIAGYLACAVVAYLLLNRAWKEEGPSDVDVHFDYRNWLRLGFPFIWISLSTTLLARFDIFVLGGVVDANSLAVYIAAVRVAAVAQIGLGVFEMIARPMFARGYELRDAKGVLSTYINVTVGVMVLSLPFAIFVMVKPSLVLSVFGTGFKSGGGALAVLMGGKLVYAIGGVGGAFLGMANRQKIYAVFTVITTVSVMILDLLFIPRYGIYGAAWVSLFGNVALSLLMAVGGISLLRSMFREKRHEERVA